MAGYPKREVARLLGLPASTLRHWEREFPLLAPKKDAFGRRVYSNADLRLLLRLKHFAVDRGLGLAAARIRLEAELAGPMPDERARIEEVRDELITLLARAGEAGRKLD